MHACMVWPHGARRPARGGTLHLLGRAACRMSAAAGSYTHALVHRASMHAWFRPLGKAAHTTVGMVALLLGASLAWEVEGMFRHVQHAAARHAAPAALHRCTVCVCRGAFRRGPAAVSSCMAACAAGAWPRLGCKVTPDPAPSRTRPSTPPTPPPGCRCRATRPTRAARTALPIPPPPTPFSPSGAQRCLPSWRPC